MAISAIGTVADGLLSAFLENSLKAALGSQNTVGLFVPQDLTDPTTRLSPRELVSLLRNVRGTLVSLAASAARLDLASPTSAFFAGTVTSSDAFAITGTVRPGTSPETAPVRASYVFTVSGVAAAQTNVGTALQSAQLSAFQVGVNSFRVTQGGTSTDVSFLVLPTETNAQVLANMAAAINADTSLGVQASVNTDAVAGTSRLVVQAKRTGTANAFTLADLSALTGDPVNDAGVGSATTAAADASYTLNGVPLTSASNEVYLGTNAHLKVTFITSTSAPVVLKVEPDVAQISAAISTLASAFNNAKALFENQADVFPGPVTQLHSVVSRLNAQLRTIGLVVEGDGSVSVDHAKLAVALDQYTSAVERALGDVGGLAKELRAIGETLLATPRVMTDPLPPYRPGHAPRVLVGAFAGRLNGLQLRGLLIDALV